MAMDSMEITTICDCQLLWVVRVSRRPDACSTNAGKMVFAARGLARVQPKCVWNTLILEAFLPQIQIYQVALSLSGELNF